MTETPQILESSSGAPPQESGGLEKPLLTEATARLAAALFELRTGMATDSERTQARALTEDFVTLLADRMVVSLQELEQAGAGELSILQGAIEESKHYLYDIYAGVDERVGESSDIREAVEKARVTRCGRLLGRAAMFALITSASIATVKGFDVGISQIDQSHAAGLGLGVTIAAGIAKKTLSEPVGKLVKGVGAKFGERFMEEEDEGYLREIRDDEKSLGFELASEQRADSLYRLKASDDIKSLHEEIALAVVERSKDYNLNLHEIAQIIGEVTKRHISDLFDLEGKKRPFVGVAKSVAEDTIKGYVGGRLGPVVADATEPVMQSLNNAA
ncbi:MAG: hypothetical protein U0520_00665 [Candidatus Saccharimonadales bacterium]